MRIANIVQDSIVDGPGLRFVVFVQGCTHGCKGCHNPGTHDPNGGREMSVGEILDMIRKNPLVSGVTISGGEPFDQAEECLELAKGVSAMGLNLWVYTGYYFDEIWDRACWDAVWFILLDYIDVLVDGPFIENMKSYEAKFRGSRNQHLIDIPRTLETENIDEVMWEPSPRMEWEVPES